VGLHDAGSQEQIMFAFVSSGLAYAKHWFERAMVEPDINSRLVFLLSTGVSSLAILILTIAFICAKNPSDNYPYLAGAVGGAAVGHGFSRYLTKRDGGDANTPPKE
jgi:hypothetical protein